MAYIEKLVQKLKGWYYQRRAYGLIRNGDFENALTHIARIQSIEEQRQFIMLSLAAYAGSILAKRQAHEFEIHFTRDLPEYERWRLLSGSSDQYKRLIYVNPKTGNVEAGLEEIVDKVIPSDNPLKKRLQELEGKS